MSPLDDLLTLTPLSPEVAEPLLAATLNRFDIGARMLNIAAVPGQDPETIALMYGDPSRFRPELAKYPQDLRAARWAVLKGMIQGRNPVAYDYIVRDAIAPGSGLLPDDYIDAVAYHVAETYDVDLLSRVIDAGALTDQISDADLDTILATNLAADTMRRLITAGNPRHLTRLAKNRWKKPVDVWTALIDSGDGNVLRMLAENENFPRAELGDALVAAIVSRMDSDPAAITAGMEYIESRAWPKDADPTPLIDAALANLPLAPKTQSYDAAYALARVVIGSRGEDLPADNVDEAWAVWSVHVIDLEPHYTAHQWQQKQHAYNQVYLGERFLGDSRATEAVKVAAAESLTGYGTDDRDWITYAVRKDDLPASVYRALLGVIAKRRDDELVRMLLTNPSFPAALLTELAGKKTKIGSLATKILADKTAAAAAEPTEPQFPTSDVFLDESLSALDLRTFTVTQVKSELAAGYRAGERIDVTLGRILALKEIPSGLRKNLANMLFHVLIQIPDYADTIDAATVDNMYQFKDTDLMNQELVDRFLAREDPVLAAALTKNLTAFATT